MPRIMPEARYFSMPSTKVGRRIRNLPAGADNRLVAGSSPLSPTTQSCANPEFPVSAEHPRFSAVWGGCNGPFAVSAGNEDRPEADWGPSSLASEIRFPVRGEGPGQSENATLLGPDFGFAKIDLSGGGQMAEMVKIETVPSLRLATSASVPARLIEMPAGPSPVSRVVITAGGFPLRSSTVSLLSGTSVFGSAGSSFMLALTSTIDSSGAIATFCGGPATRRRLEFANDLGRRSAEIDESDGVIRASARPPIPDPGCSSTVHTSKCLSTKLPRENNLEENSMTLKLSLIAAVAAAALLIPAGAFAGGRMHDGWRGDHWRGDRGRGDHWRGDRGRGHWYHGRWWGYGEGRCWRRTPVGWVWICGD